MIPCAWRGEHRRMFTGHDPIFLEFEYGKGGLNICGMNQRIYTGLKVAVIQQSLLPFKNQPELKTSSQLAGL